MHPIIERLKEPSTWAGVGLIGAAFGIPPGTIELAGQVVMGLAGLAAVFLKERSKS